MFCFLPASIRPRSERLSLLLGLRRHINQVVALKSGAIVIAAAVVILHSGDRCGGATRRKRANDGTQRQDSLGHSKRLPGGGSGLLRGGSLLLRGGGLLLRGDSLLLRGGSLLLGRGRLLLGL